MTTKHKTREAWLEAAVSALTPLFTDLGHDLPPVRVSVGFPGGGSARTRIGECWHGASSEDGVGQLFVSPVIGDALRVLDILAHELVHAVNHANGDNGHGRPFAKIAKPLGLEGRMTATTANAALTEKLQVIAAKLGDYPHSALKLGADTTAKKQSTRQLKVECASGSGYKVRMTRQWLDEVGAPICPCHGDAMEEAA